MITYKLPKAREGQTVVLAGVQFNNGICQVPSENKILEKYYLCRKVSLQRAVIDGDAEEIKDEAPTSPIEAQQEEPATTTAPQPVKRRGRQKKA